MRGHHSFVRKCADEGTLTIVKAGVLAYSRADLEMTALVKRTAKNKIHERRRTNADQRVPRLDDPNADEQTPLTERQWVARQWR